VSGSSLIGGLGTEDSVNRLLEWLECGGDLRGFVWVWGKVEGSDVEWGEFRQCGQSLWGGELVLVGKGVSVGGEKFSRDGEIKTWVGILLKKVRFAVQKKGGFGTLRCEFGV